MASRGAGAQSVTVKTTGCGFDPHTRRWNIYLNLYFHFFALVSRTSAALSSATQHAVRPEFGRKWGTECLNTRFPLPTLLCAGYSVKLKKKILWYIKYCVIHLVPDINDVFKETPEVIKAQQNLSEIITVSVDTDDMIDFICIIGI